MRKTLVLAAFLVAGCGYSRLTEAELTSMRTTATPGARAQCAAFGFTDQTPLTLSRCIDSAVASYMESRVPWQRLEASGVNYLGNEEMEAIANCVSKQIDPASTQMLSCFQAERILAVRRQNQETTEMNMRAAQIRAMSAPVRVAPRTCITNAGVTNCF